MTLLCSGLPHSAVVHCFSGLGCKFVCVCVDCEEHHFHHEGLCVPGCPERFFESKEQMECLRCHADCALCTGPGRDDCSACVDPEATLNNGECVQSCPSHHYTDSLTGECAGRSNACNIRDRICLFIPIFFPSRFSQNVTSLALPVLVHTLTRALAASSITH